MPVTFKGTQEYVINKYTLIVDVVHDFITYLANRE